jgi:hypothetical protein
VAFSFDLNEPGLCDGLGDAAAFGRTIPAVIANAAVPAIPAATRTAAIPAASRILRTMCIPIGVSSKGVIGLGATLARPSMATEPQKSIGNGCEFRAKPTWEDLGVDLVVVAAER